MNEILEYLQTPAGITIMLAVWSFVLARVFTKKPKWQKYYEQYRGTLIAAVKVAEKTIPDDTDNKSAQRLDAALKFALKIIGKADEKALTEALSVVHDEVTK